MTLEQNAKRAALKNAIEHDGKTNPGAVVGLTIQICSIAKNDPKDSAPIIIKVANEVNKLSLEEQKTEYKKLGEVKQEKKVHKKFDFLRIPVGIKVTSCFPPEPSKYFHIGHAKSLYVNYLLAKEHKGKFILRFDDTNPELAKEEFYQKQLDDTKWLGIQPDKVIYASDYLEQIDDYANQLIMNGNAYFCDCTPEIMSNSRKKRQACKHQEQTNTNGKEEVRLVSDLKDRETVRLKLDMTSDNSTFRDPVIYRRIDKKHVRVKNRVVWPSYDFETAILDGVEKVNYRIRGKEFELRTHLQNYIQELLKLQKTNYYEYARFEIKGAETSGRLIREGIKEKKYLGWDDPSLVNLVALKRRGFLPDALKNFLITTGFSKAESTLTWEDLIKHNRRLLDKTAHRYFFVKDPVKIVVNNAPTKKLKLNLNPNKKTGGRTFTTSEEFFITKEDYDNMKLHELYRLMDCINFKKTDNGFEYVGGDINDYRKEGKGIFHWVNKDSKKTTILMPNKEKVNGVVEKNIYKEKVGNIIQFERFGFCRLDSANSFWYTHR